MKSTVLTIIFLFATTSVLAQDASHEEISRLLFQRDIVTLESIPNADEIVEVTIRSGRPCLGNATLTQEIFKQIINTAEPIDASDPSVIEWHYSIPCEGTFTTKEGTYSFKLYSGRGLLVTPDGKAGLFSCIYKEQPSLQLTIKSDKKVYALGEEIAIDAEIKNISDTTTNLEDVVKWPGHESFILKNESGEECRLVYKGPINREIPPDLPPGKTLRIGRYPISWLKDKEFKWGFEFEQIKGSDYLFTGKQNIYMQGWGLTSNPITIEVVENKGSGIYNGAVVAFGRIIPPPYVVSDEDGKVMINGIVYSPREQDPAGIKPGDVKVTEMQMKRYNLTKALGKRYAELHDGLGEEQARKNIIEEFKEDPIIKGMEFKERDLWVEFIDGNTEWINVDSYVQAAQGSYYPTQAEKDEMRKREITGIKKALNNDGAFIFGYRYTIMTSGRKLGEAQKIVTGLKAGRYDEDMATMELEKLLGPQGKDFFLDIKRNGLERFE